MKVRTIMAAMALALVAGPLVSQSTALAAAPSGPFRSHPVPYIASSVLPSTQAARDAAADVVLRPVEGEVPHAWLRRRRKSSSTPKVT